MLKLLLGGIVASLAVAPAAAGEIVVFCPGAVQSVVRPMAKTFEEKTRNTVKFEFATAGAVAKKVADGATGDVVLTTDKALGQKIQLRDRGPDGLKEVAAGEIEIGLGQISEILANKDVVLVGPLPPAIQGAVTFSGAIHSQAKDKAAAKALIDLLTSPEAKEKFRAVGFSVS
jgi:ABC-type molybdate transport system substrate-binding protein